MRRQTMEMDPRLAARRAQVAESRVRRGLMRLLWLLLLVAIGGLVAWAFQSPFLSVGEVSFSGSVRSDPAAVIARMGMGAGTPMISVDVAGVEAALQEDPWVAAAEVTRHWPDRLAVTVTERVPLAWAQTSAGWVRVAVDGVVLEAGAPGEGDPILVVPEVSPDALTGDETVLGALLFLDSLRDDLAGGAAVAVLHGELQARVGEVDVRLGRAVEMEQKARALAGVMDAGVEPESVITLIAPARPAVLAPGAVTTTTSTPAVEVDEAGEDG